MAWDNRKDDADRRCPAYDLWVAAGERWGPRCKWPVNRREYKDRISRPGAKPVLQGGRPGSGKS